MVRARSYAVVGQECGCLVVVLGLVWPLVHKQGSGSTLDARSSPVQQAQRTARCTCLRHLCDSFCSVYGAATVLPPS
jgi:hypothetical protein